MNIKFMNIKFELIFLLLYNIINNGRLYYKVQ